LQLKNNHEAFEYVESSKSRAFLYILAGTPIKPNVEPTNELEQLLIKEQLLIMKLRDLQAKNLNQRNSTMASGDIDQLLREKKELYNKIRQIDPEYALMRSGQTISFRSTVMEILSDSYASHNR
jgi:hypothetical protein